jgi:hypothetical protein
VSEPNNPEPGLVISYAYLWHTEFMDGKEEGLKHRPCVIVSATPQAEGWQRVLALPITHSPPSDPDLVQEIPVVVRRHLRLDDERSWIILSETSEFHWPGPDLGHSAPGSALVYERLPPRFFEKIRQRFIATITAGRTACIRRTK